MLRTPCDTPVSTSFGTMYDRPAVFVRITADDGATGLGEVWCNFPVCGAEHRAQLLQTTIFPVLVDTHFERPSDCFQMLQSQFARLALQAGEPGPLAQVIAGVDIAIWDMVARRNKLPLFRLLGGTSAEIGAYASGINPADAPDTVNRCRQQGHRAFKLKIGFDRNSDLENIEDIVAGLHSEESFMVDANQAWNPQEAMDRTRELMAYPIRWLEEPVMADTSIEQWNRLAASSSIPLAAGENIISEAGFMVAIEGDWLETIQPDLCKWGGISGTFRVARAILSAGKRYCPHFLGGGIGLAASAHLLAAVGGNGLLEIDANTNPLRTELFSPIVAQGNLRLSETAGHGTGLDEFDRLVGAYSKAGAPSQIRHI